MCMCILPIFMLEPCCDKRSPSSLHDLPFKDALKFSPPCTTAAVVRQACFVSAWHNEHQCFASECNRFHQHPQGLLQWSSMDSLEKPYIWTKQGNTCGNTRFSSMLATLVCPAELATTPRNWSASSVDGGESICRNVGVGPSAPHPSRTCQPHAITGTIMWRCSSQPASCMIIMIVTLRYMNFEMNMMCLFGILPLFRLLERILLYIYIYS